MSKDVVFFAEVDDLLHLLEVAGDASGVDRVRQQPAASSHPQKGLDFFE